MRVSTVIVGLVVALGLCACQGGGRGDNPFESEESKDNRARVDHYENAAVTYYDGGRYIEAERMFAAWLEEQPNNKKAKHGLARSKLMQGGAAKLREAEDIFVELVEMPWHHPERGDISYEVESGLATTYMQLADLYDRDVRALDNTLRSDSVADGSRTRRQLQQQIERRNELLYKAVPLWSSVIKKNDRNPYALAGLAKANLQLGNDHQGIRYARQYLQLSRESQTKWRQQLDSWVERVGEENVTGAQRNQLLAKAHGARQKEKLMHLLLASVYMRRQEYREAAQSYTDVIDIDASVPAAYIERAQAYAALRRYTLAVEDIEHYLKITDPQMHREERVQAGELLQRYRMAVNGGGPRPDRRREVPPAPDRVPADPWTDPAPGPDAPDLGFPRPESYPEGYPQPIDPRGR